MEAMNKPLPVKGYRAQSDVKIEVVNHNKEVEEVVLRACDSLKQNLDVDQRWLAIGRTHIEQGFMAINRAIFKPDRVQLESDVRDDPGDVVLKEPVSREAQFGLARDRNGDIANPPELSKVQASVPSPEDGKR